MPAGSAFAYLGTLVHGGGANSTDASRLAISFQYCAGWGRQQENFLLALGPERTRALPTRLQELVGISIHSLMMGMVDGRHPRKALDAD
jgi:ectoine hydroxylase-related dioxygenase (phytanoyl-CoA dioxygenase family)